MAFTPRVVDVVVVAVHGRRYFAEMKRKVSVKKKKVSGKKKKPFVENMHSHRFAFFFLHFFSFSIASESLAGAGAEAGAEARGDAGPLENICNVQRQKRKRKKKNQQQKKNKKTKTKQKTKSKNKYRNHKPPSKRLNPISSSAPSSSSIGLTSSFRTVKGGLAMDSNSMGSSNLVMAMHVLGPND